METGRAEALAWLEGYVESLEEPAVAALALRLARETAEGMPELGAGSEIVEDLQALARENIRSFFAVLGRDPWAQPDVPVAGIEFTRTLVRRGGDLPVLLKVYRRGQTAFWRAAMTTAERDIDDPELRMRVLMTMWERLSLWVESVLGRQIEVYEEERDRFMRGALARRVEMIGALLAGEPVDPARAGRTLGYELGRHHTALVLRCGEAASETGAAEALEGLAAAAATALGAGRALTTPSGTRGLWAWIGTDESPDLDHLLALAAQVEAGVHLAVGSPGHGPAGFRRSHLEALEAQRIARRATGAAALTRYQDVELASMLSHDEAAMRALVRRELEGLLGEDDASRRLRTTALAFLGNGCNARAAAEALGTHKNTVLYRLRRIEELLGHPIGEHRLSLELALMLVDAFGPGVAGAASAPRR